MPPAHVEPFHNAFPSAALRQGAWILDANWGRPRTTLGMLTILGPWMAQDREWPRYWAEVYWTKMVQTTIFHEGETHPKKKKTPKQKGQFAQTISEQIVKCVPPVPCKISRKQVERGLRKLFVQRWVVFLGWVAFP